MEGLLVDKVPEKDTELQEVENTSLSLWWNWNVHAIIREALEKKWYTIDRLLDEIIDVAENAYSSPRWEGWADFWKRLKALELLME